MRIEMSDLFVLILSHFGNENNALRLKGRTGLI